MGDRSVHRSQRRIGVGIVCRPGAASSNVGGGGTGGRHSLAVTSFVTFFPVSVLDQPLLLHRVAVQMGKKMAEERTLPGWPKRKLVKEVRRHLSHYGIRPTKFDIWRATWTWAEAIARSYWHIHWPLPSEIATQYILLLLVEMKASCMLRLPYRASEIVPPEVARLFPAAQQARWRCRGSSVQHLSQRTG